MHKNILLINPNTSASTGTNRATIYPPYGLAYIASYLRKYSSKYSYEIKIVDANILELSIESVLKIAKEFSPDIVGVHMNIITAAHGVEICRALNSIYPDAKVCIGGPLASSNPKELLEASSADIAVIGEGEITFLDICEDKLPDTIPGIMYRKGDTVLFTEIRLLIEDIDEIPFPAYDLLPDINKYRSRMRKKPVSGIITSRGCPYQCIFCSCSVFGKTYRAHTPEYVLREIDYLINNYKIAQLNILDDNFTLKTDRAEKILDLIIERKYNLLIDLENGIRVDNLTEDFVKKMSRAGVFKVGIGIESADKDVLLSIKKGLDLQKVEKSFIWLKKYDIMTFAFFIIGFPQDTEKTVSRTIKFAIDNNPSIANFSLLLPFPGTEIFEYLKKNNLLEYPDNFIYSTGFFDKKMYHHCRNLDSEQIHSLMKKAYIKFYFRISKIIELIFGIRSFEEFKWVVKISYNILRDVLLK